MGVLRVKLDDGTWVDVVGGGTDPDALTQTEADARYVQGNADLTVGATPPASPATNDLWVDTNP